MPVVFDQLGLTRLVHRQNFGPDEGEQRPQLLRLRRQQLENIGKDPNRQGTGDSPRPEVKELAEKLESLEAVLLAQEHLQDDGQLLGRRL